MAALESLTEGPGAEIEAFQALLEKDGEAELEGCKLTKQMVSWTKVKETHPPTHPPI